MYKLISFIVIFSFVSTMLYFHHKSGHQYASVHEKAHSHMKVEVPANEPIPIIKGSLKKSKSEAWSLHLETDHFMIVPKKMGTKNINPSEGHAHLYINGKKIKRL